MNELLFFHFRVMNVKLTNENISLNIAVSKRHDCLILLRFLYLACFVVNYIRDIYLSMLDFNDLCMFSNIFINKIPTAKRTYSFEMV